MSQTLCLRQNGQTHFKNLGAFAARFLKSVRPFSDIMHYRVNLTPKSIMT